MCLMLYRNSFLLCCISVVRSCLPLPMQNAKYQRELEAAVDVVQRACCLCVDVIALFYSLLICYRFQFRC